MYLNSCRSKMLFMAFSYNHAVVQIYPTRTTSDFNHSGLMELSTEISNIASGGNQRRIDFENKSSLSEWCRYFKLDRTNLQQFWWPVWNNLERNLKRFSHLKCKHMFEDISYKVKVWNAKHNSMYFI